MKCEGCGAPVVEGVIAHHRWCPRGDWPASSAIVPLPTETIHPSTGTRRSKPAS